MVKKAILTSEFYRNALPITPGTARFGDRKLRCPHCTSDLDLQSENSCIQSLLLLDVDPSRKGLNPVEILAVAACRNLRHSSDTSPAHLRKSNAAWTLRAASTRLIVLKSNPVMVFVMVPMSASLSRPSSLQRIFLDHAYYWECCESFGQHTFKILPLSNQTSLWDTLLGIHQCQFNLKS